MAGKNAQKKGRGPKSQVGRSNKGKSDGEPNQILSRYTRLEALFEMLELGGIPLYGTERWDDECDKAFVRRGCAAGGTDQCGILCLVGMEKKDIRDAIKNSREYVWSRETYGHWKIYTPSSAVSSPLDFGIRIDFDKKMLDTLIARMTKERVCCRLDKMSYKPYEKYLSAAGNPNKDWFFLKRDAYKWEMEHRLVVLGQNKIPSRAKDRGARGFIKINGVWKSDKRLWLRLIKNVVFSPFCHLQGSPTALDTELIRFYAVRSLERYCAGKKEWTRAKVKWTQDFLNSCARSGILDNTRVLTAMQNASSAKTGIVPHGRCSECENKSVCRLRSRVK